MLKLGAMLGACVLGAAMMAGCATSPIKGKPFGAGSIYSEVQFNERTDAQASLGMKQGESCATVILGAFATGDTSVATAAKAAGITKIAAVDGYNTSILGLYSKYCIRVSGE